MTGTKRPTSRRLTPNRRSAVLGLVLGVGLALPACGGDEADLCDEYEDLQAAVAQVDELDPETATTEDFDAVADDILGELQQLQAAVVDTGYDQAISTLRTTLTDLRQAAVDLAPTDLDVARELLADSVDATVTAYQLLAQRLDVACSPG